jgi:hypothetical protein
MRGKLDHERPSLSGRARSGLAVGGSRVPLVGGMHRGEEELVALPALLDDCAAAGGVHRLYTAWSIASEVARRGLAVTNLE